MDKEYSTYEASFDQDQVVDAQDASCAPAVPETIDGKLDLGELLESMKTRRRDLYAILEHCRDLKPVADVNAFVDELQKEDRTVYSGAILCNMLERAGALERVDGQGAPLSGEVREPEERIDDDGIERLVPSQAVPVFWHTTDAGAQALEEWDPVGQAIELIESDPRLKGIYLTVLEQCDCDGGKTIKQLSAVVDDDPAVQQPRLFAAHFVDGLEEVQALRWEKAWTITEIGRKVLAEMMQSDAAAAQSGADEAAGAR